MDLLNHLLIGFENAVTWTNLLYCFVGVTLGTLVGVLPGMGPVATVAMLLPITYALDPSTALIMLAGIYYGAQYGGSTTAILVNIPGEASAVVSGRPPPGACRPRRRCARHRRHRQLHRRMLCHCGDCRLC